MTSRQCKNRREPVADCQWWIRGRKSTPENWASESQIDGVQYLWDKKSAHSGKSSLCFKKTARRYFPIAQWAQEVLLSDAPASLKVGAWIKAQRTTKATLDVQFLDARRDDLAQMGCLRWGQGGKRPAGYPRLEMVRRCSSGSGRTKRFVVALQIYGPGVGSMT